jgi:hypothetical protein
LTRSSEDESEDEFDEDKIVVIIETPVRTFTLPVLTC